MTAGRLDAVITGGGPAGCAAAILLARGGWSVALVEKQEFPRRKVCGECIAASNLPLLEDLGVGAAIAAAAGPELRKVAWMNGRREVVSSLPAAPDARFPWGRALGRETLDTLLLREAQRSGAQVLQPWLVQEIEGRAGEWSFLLRGTDSQDTMTLRSRVAIAAHGSWEGSPLGRGPGRRARRASDLLAFKANFRGAALEAGTLPVLSLDGGYGGMVLADGGMATVACCIRRDRLEALRAAAPGLRAGDAVESWLRRECAGVRRALTPAARAGAWLSAGPIDPGIRLRNADGIFRIGNAAGEVHPIVGEGISMALQSAALLCARLLAGAEPGSAMDEGWQSLMSERYRADWHRNFARRMRFAAFIAHAAMRPAPSALVMGVLRAWPAFLGAGATWAGKTRLCATRAG